MDRDGSVSIDELELKIQKCSKIPLDSPTVRRSKSDYEAMKSSTDSEILSQYKESKMD